MNLLEKLNKLRDNYLKTIVGYIYHHSPFYLDIIESDVLWLTHYEDLQDRDQEEIKHGLEVILQEIELFINTSKNAREFEYLQKKLKQIFSEHLKFYIFSTTAEKDNEHMWKEFNKFKGAYFAIASEKPEEKLDVEIGSYVRFAGKVKYNEAEFRELIAEMLKEVDYELNLLRNHPFNKRKSYSENRKDVFIMISAQFILLSAFQKRKTYEEEDEYRWVALEFRIGGKCYPSDLSKWELSKVQGKVNED